MNLTTLLLAFVSLASETIAESQKLRNAVTCKTKAPDAYSAINEFCYGETHITVPSDYAKEADYSGDTFAKIGGESDCDPPQWVPRKYCLRNFYEVCANGNEHGRGKGTYGRNGCQSFHIGKTT